MEENVTGGTILDLRLAQELGTFRDMIGVSMRVVMPLWEKL